MASPLFNMFNPQPNPVPVSNGVLDILARMPGGANAITQVQQLLQTSNQSPEQLAKMMIQSGRFSQDQINYNVQLANMITGRRG